MARRKQSVRAAVRLLARAKLPTRFGTFTVLGARGRRDGEEAVVLLHGAVNGKVTPLVRVHSQCLTGDVLASARCDCRAQLELSLRKIGRARSGALLYLPQEGRGIGLMNKLKAYEWQDKGLDTVEANHKVGFAADLRDYHFPGAVLRKLGVRRVRLLSNNPDKVKQLEESGVRVVQRIPCQPRTSRLSQHYLRTKKVKLGHLLRGV